MMWSPGPGTVLESVSSTNDWLKAQPRAIGDWVVARQQTSGRGRGGNSWTSPPGNLYLSVVLPRQEPLTLASLALAVAVVGFCRGEGVPVTVKWPNDLCIGGQKLGGILCETVSGAVVAGVGLNLVDRDLPREAISAQRWCAVADPLDWARRLVACLPLWTSTQGTAMQQNRQRIEAHWLELWHGEEREFGWGEQHCRGRLVGINLKEDQGEILTNGKIIPVTVSQLTEFWPEISPVVAP